MIRFKPADNDYESVVRSLQNGCIYGAFYQDIFGSTRNLSDVLKLMASDEMDTSDIWKSLTNIDEDVVGPISKLMHTISCHGLQNMDWREYERHVAGFTKWASGSYLNAILFAVALFAMQTVGQRNDYYLSWDKARPCFGAYSDQCYIMYMLLVRLFEEGTFMPDDLRNVAAQTEDQEFSYALDILHRKSSKYGLLLDTKKAKISDRKNHTVYCALHALSLYALAERKEPSKSALNGFEYILYYGQSRIDIPTAATMYITLLTLSERLSDTAPVGAYRNSMIYAIDTACLRLYEEGRQARIRKV